MMTPEENLQQQAAIARATHQQHRLRHNRLHNRINPQAQSIGFDSASGSDIIQLADGSITQAASLTNGVRSTGSTVQLHQGMGEVSVDQMPTVPKLVSPNQTTAQEKYPIKVLYSVYEGLARKFYIGGYQDKPILVLEIGSGCPVLEAYISNTGSSKSDWIVGIKYQLDLAVNPDVVVVTVYGKNYHTPWTITGDIAKTLTWRGNGFWVSYPIPEIWFALKLVSQLYPPYAVARIRQWFSSDSMYYPDNIVIPAQVNNQILTGTSGAAISPKYPFTSDFNANQIVINYTNYVVYNKQIFSTPCEYRASVIATSMGGLTVATDTQHVNMTEDVFILPGVKRPSIFLKTIVFENFFKLVTRHHKKLTYPTLTDRKFNVCLAESFTSLDILSTNPTGSVNESFLLIDAKGNQTEVKAEAGLLYQFSNLFLQAATLVASSTTSATLYEAYAAVSAAVQGKKEVVELAAFDLKNTPSGYTFIKRPVGPKVKIFKISHPSSRPNIHSASYYPSK